MKRSIYFPICMLLVCLCAFSVGCKKNVPIQDMMNGSIRAHGKMTQDKVRDAIIRAGSKIGWQMVEEKSGMVVATLTTRAHTVVVEIPYTANEYRIHYRSSVNMDAKDGTIHRNYNRWIDRLHRNINAEMLTVDSAGGGKR